MKNKPYPRLRPFPLFVLLSLLFTLACIQPSGDPNRATTEETEKTLDRFESSILDFEKEDQEKDIHPNGILFTGSSSIRMWESLSEDMAPLPALNRGFGGSTLPEMAYYAKRVILPYQPKLIVLYCGENDISEGATAEEVLQSYKGLVARIRVHLPECHIAYISMKPSIARWSLWPEFQKGNELIEAYTDRYSHLYYLDSSAKMLHAGGDIDTTIFIEDGLHMNAEGYKRWTELIRPFATQKYQELTQTNGRTE